MYVVVVAFTDHDLRARRDWIWASGHSLQLRLVGSWEYSFDIVGVKNRWHYVREVFTVLHNNEGSETKLNDNQIRGKLL